MKITKQGIFGFILGGLLFGSIGVCAATVLSSGSVSYSNTTSGLTSTNVQGAIDELFIKASEGGPSKEINNVVLGVTAKTQDAKASGSFAFSTASIDTLYCKWSQPGSHYGGATYKCADNATGKLSNLTCSETGSDVSNCDAVTVTVTCNGRNNSGFSQSGTCRATVSSNPF